MGRLKHFNVHEQIWVFLHSLFSSTLAEYRQRRIWDLVRQLWSFFAKIFDSF